MGVRVFVHAKRTSCRTAVRGVRMTDAVDWHTFVRNVATTLQPAQVVSSNKRVVGVDAVSLRPPQRLPTRVSTPWSAYTMSAAGGTLGRRVAVPHTAIARIYPAFESPPFGRCARCPPSECVCAHGWSLPDARSIVMVRIRSNLGADAVLYGWFVRYESDPTHLVRVPPSIVRLLIAHHCTDISMVPGHTASMLLMHQPHDGVDFCVHAVAQFMRLRARIERQESDDDAAAELHKRKRSPHAETTESGAQLVDSALVQTCCVCLEQTPDATPRCAHATCSTAVCSGCHDSLRGLCPICNRGANDALFECAGCGVAQPLRRSGMPCLGCNRNVVCRTCFKCYGACRACV